MFKRFIPMITIAIAAMIAASACSTPSTEQAAQTQAPPEPTAEQTSAAEPSPTPSGGAGATMDYAAFVSAVEAAGWPVEEIGPTSGSLFTGDGHIIRINGIEVQVFEYPDNQALEAQAELISKDGSQIGGPSGEAIVDWVDMPHFFKSGRILAVYIGRAERTLLALKDALGEEFAGGTIEAWGLGEPTPIPPGDSGGLGGMDTAELAKALQGAGAAVVAGDPIPQDLFSVGGQLISVNGQNIEVFQYADNAAAAADAATITGGGSIIGERAVDYAGPPNYYHTGRLIVLYVGTDADTMRLLEMFLGKPIF